MAQPLCFLVIKTEFTELMLIHQDDLEKKALFHFLLCKLKLGETIVKAPCNHTAEILIIIFMFTFLSYFCIVL